MSLPFGDSQLLPKPCVHRRTLSSFAPLSAGTSRNSSMNGILAEDYYDSQTVEIGAAAMLSSRTSPLSGLVQEEGESSPRPTRTHQRSLTSLLPFRVRPRDDSKSPERISPRREKTQRELEDDLIPTFTGDTDGVIRVGEKQRGGLSSWFSGSSAPISLGIPVTELETPSPFNGSPADASPQQESAKLRKKPNLSSVESTGSNSNMPTKAPSSAASRFNFFSPKTPPKQMIQLPQRMIEDDDLLSLDIHAALLPFPPPSQDALSPSAFNDLLMNAEGLLLRLQTAYKLRSLSLHELGAEMEAQDDELDEAETRAQCLKSQLEEMSDRVAEQDKVVEDLVEQLATEKQARTEEKLAHERSIALITRERSASEVADDQGPFGKRLHHQRPRRWRESGGSASTECDSDAELASPTDSVFSRSRSPAPTITSMLSSATCTSADTTPEILQASFARVVSLQQQPGSTSPQQHQRASPVVVSQSPQPQRKPGSTAFQKILHGISATTTSAGCENCRGGDAGVAWDTVGLLRAENRGLKERVGSLEGAVETALDLCSGIGRF